MRKLFYITVVALVATSLSVPAFAADTAAAPAAPAATAPPAAPAAPAATAPNAASTAPAYGSDHSLDADWLKGFHNPTDWATMGADLRLRWEYWDKATTLTGNGHQIGDISSYFRYRGRIWTTLKLDKDIDINARMVYEPRTYLQPNSDNPDAPGTAGPTRVNEALFDKLNITMRNFLDLPVTAVIGRQEIILGKGWLIAEGTPVDGSRTMYFDAARFTWQIDTDNTLDMIYVDQHANENQWLHPINSQDLATGPTDEQDGMLYWTNKSLKDTTFEGYALYKNDNPVNGSFPNSGINPTNSFKDELMTYGGAISQNLDKNWDYRVEAAYQTGFRQTTQGGKMHDVDSYATNNVLTYKFNDPCENATHFGWEYLSGNKRSTDRFEGFDTLWGEYARWCDLYAYTYKNETGNAVWTNLNKFDIGHTMKLDPQWSVSGDYYLLLAPEHNKAGTGTTPQFGNGYVRGQMLQGYLRYQYSKQLSGHLCAEYLIPGNYYGPETRSNAMFFRAEISYVF